MPRGSNNNLDDFENKFKESGSMFCEKFVNKKMNVFLACLLAIVFSISAITPAFAQTGQLTKEQKLEILYTPTFYTCGVEDPDNNQTDNIQETTTERESELLAMSDNDFKKEIKERIQWAIDQKEAGAHLYWHPTALKSIDIVSPELGSVVTKQLSTQPDQLRSELTMVQTTGNFTPGSTSVVFWIINSSFGIDLWKFNMRVNWAWDTTRITSLSYNCFANIYSGGDQYGWTYQGINDQYGYYVVNYYAYDQYCEGYFSCPAGGAYPYLDALVQADGIYTWDRGFN